MKCSMVWMCLILALFTTVWVPTVALADVTAHCECVGSCNGTEGSNIQFDAGSSQPQGQLDFYWSFEHDSGHSNMVDPVKTFNKPGVWTSSVRVTDILGGGSDTDECLSTITNINPTAVIRSIDITSSNATDYRCSLDDRPTDDSLCEVFFYAGNYAYFNATDSFDEVGGITRYQWDFDYQEGNFSPAAGQSGNAANYAFANPGDYQVALRVYDDDENLADGVPAGEDIDVILVHIVPTGPVAVITPPEGMLYESETHEFSGAQSIYPGGSITSYEWDWDYDPNSDEDSFQTDSTGMIAFADFPEKGNYYVALRVTDDQSRTHTSHVRVYVENSPPVARLTRDGGPTVNEGALVRLDGSTSSANPGSIVTWQWDMNYDGDGFYEYPNYHTSVVNYAFPNQGSYRVALRIYDDDHTDINPAGGFYESWDLTDITVNVVDVPPEALFTMPAQMMQGVFEQVDASASHSGVGSQDEIVRYEWCFYYTGDPSIFPPFPAVEQGQPGYESYQLAVQAYNQQCFPEGYTWEAYNTPQFNCRYLQTGDFQVVLRVTDNDSDGAKIDLSNAFSVNVVASPPTPVIAISDGTAFGDLLECSNYVLTAEDSFVPPPSSITNYIWDIDYQGNPDGFTPYEECTGSVTCSVFCGDGTPANSFNVALKIIADNGETGIVSQTVVCNEVRPTITNKPPSLVTTAEDAQYTYQAMINDPCVELGQDSLTFSITCDPQDMTISEDVGSIFWTPDQSVASCTSTDTNPVGCLIRVTDEDHGSWTDSTTWQIVVLNQNDAPVLQGIIYSSTAVVGVPWTASLQVYDEDKEYCPTYESFSFRQIGQPSGATIDSSGTIHWTPSDSQTGNKQWEACVKDADDEERCGTLAVQVSAAQSVPLASLCEDNPDPGLSHLPGLFSLCADAQDQNDPPQSLSYAWTQLSGPQTVFINQAQRDDFTADVELLRSGEYVFQFIATNEDNVSSIALEQHITIQNVAPVANAGFDFVADLGTAVYLSGELSSDANGETLSYSWQNNDGLLSTTDQMETSFIPIEPGAYLFRLTVNDGVNSNQVDTITVEVVQREEDGTEADGAPVAYITPPAETWGHEFQFTLSGEKSADRMGGDITEYRWRFLDGPAPPQVAGSNEQATWSLAPMQPGIYTFELTVENEDYTSRPVEFVKEVHEMAGDGTITNHVPIADAGSWNSYDLVNYNESPRARHVRVELDGRGSSDEEGTPLFFQWTQTMGPAVSLDDAYAEQPVFHAFQPGLYAFELVVTEEPQTGQFGLESLPDTTYVAVNSAGNQMPMLQLKDRNADNDGMYRLQVNPGETLDLDASPTVDLDSDSLRFFWRQVSGPTAQLRGLGENYVTFLPDVIDATYWLEFWASDGKSSTLPARIRIAATATQNACPVAAVSEESILAIPGEDVVLDGSPSFDADGQELTYIWTQADTDTTLVTLTEEGSTASFTAQEIGVYHFFLDVDDGYCGSDTAASIEVTVAENQKPIANAGPDQSVLFESMVQLDGSGSLDPEGGELTYRWQIDTAASTATVQGVSLVPSASTMSPRFQATSQGTVVLTLVVTDEESIESDPDSVTIAVGSPNDNPNVCIDHDGDGYGEGGACIDEDCDDTDAEVNAGIEGSCVGCVDKDGDNYGSGMNCIGPDCDDNDPTIHIGCDEGNDDGSGGGGGGGCDSTQSPLAWLVLLGMLAFAAWQRRGSRAETR